MKFYIIGVLIFPILLPRKHLEYWLATQNPSFLFILLVVQMVNNIFEESGKAITLYVGAGVRPISKYITSLLLRLFAGMSYGIGEAFTLSFIGMKPGLGKIFGINLNLLFFLIALLYHELVDGIIIYANFHQTSPLSGFLMKHIYDVILPVLILIGVGGILILFRIKEVEP